MSGERGQSSVLMALGMVVVLAMALWLARAGRAMIDRHDSTVAADAVALAATRPDGAAAVASWYRSHGFEVAVGPGSAVVASSEGQARSWAERDDEPKVAPAVVAIVSRARQLVGRELFIVGLGDIWVEFEGDDAGRFSAVAAELGMCELATSGLSSTRRRFGLC